MFVPNLMDMLNHWFAQEAIPGCISKGVITLQKKVGRHVWEELDGYKPITLLNIELKILAGVQAKQLQLVISDLVRPEQNNAVKGRSIQDNQHLVHRILEGTEDDTDQFRSVFNRVDHQFLVLVLETTRFELEFCRLTENAWSPSQLSDWSSRVAPSSLHYILALEPLLRRLRDEKANPVLIGVPRVRARVSAFTDDITVFVSRCSDRGCEEGGCKV